MHGRAEKFSKIMSVDRPIVSVVFRVSIVLSLVELMLRFGVIGIFDSTEMTECTLLDVIGVIFFKAADRLPLDSWEPMMTAFDWAHRHPGENVYSSVFFAQHVKFQYPLTSLLPMELMNALGLLRLRFYTFVNLLLVLLTSACMAILMLDLAKWLKLPGVLKDPRMRLSIWTLGVVATLGFYPIIKALSNGQIQVWLNASFVISNILFLRDRRWLAGAILGMSSLIKPQMSLFLVWALLRKDWRLAGGWTSVVLAGVAVATMLYGFRPVIGYLDVLSFIGRHGEAYYVNQTVNGLVNRLLHNGDNLNLLTNDWQGSAFPPYHPAVFALTFASSLVFAAIGLLWCRRNQPDDQIASFMVAGICFTLSSPVAWVPHYGVVLPAFALMFLYLAKGESSEPQQRNWQLFLLTISFILISTDFFKPINYLADTPFNLLQSYMFFGTLLLLFLVWKMMAQSTSVRSGGRSAQAVPQTQGMDEPKVIAL